MAVAAEAVAAEAVAAEAALVTGIGAVLGLVVAVPALLGMRAGLAQKAGAAVPLVVVPWPAIAAVVAACLVLARRSEHDFHTKTIRHIWKSICQAVYQRKWLIRQRRRRSFALFSQGFPFDTFRSRRSRISLIKIFS
ncbi:hypothetical protein [Microbispora hainanensis]|uniref:Uncharacterized protein n=1 Tax=Microbispora hainanensis TaxID=568844 RepID=A0ABZ1SS16_9ACTN|nr:hypothetical protein [Microbispora hainanensis]